MIRTAHWRRQPPAREGLTCASSSTRLFMPPQAADISTTSFSPSFRICHTPHARHERARTDHVVSVTGNVAEPSSRDQRVPAIFVASFRRLGEKNGDSEESVPRFLFTKVVLLLHLEAPEGRYAVREARETIARDIEDLIRLGRTRSVEVVEGTPVVRTLC